MFIAFDHVVDAFAFAKAVELCQNTNLLCVCLLQAMDGAPLNMFLPYDILSWQNCHL